MPGAAVMLEIKVNTSNRVIFTGNASSMLDSAFSSARLKPNDNCVANVAASGPKSVIAGTTPRLGTLSIKKLRAPWDPNAIMLSAIVVTASVSITSAAA